MKVVILSSPMLLEEGVFEMSEITLDEAKNLLYEVFSDPKHVFQNFCGHQTVKILDLLPATRRDQCTNYNIALVVQPAQRLEFGREYSLAEIQEIGYTIKKIDYLAKDLHTLLHHA